MNGSFEFLLRQPIMMGASRESLARLVERVPMEFVKYEPCEEIVAAGSMCNELIFIMSGSVRVSAPFSEYRIVVNYDLCAPGVIGLNNIFGRSNTNPFQVTAGEQCGVMKIKKSDFVEMLQDDKVFLYNAMNQISTQAQVPAQMMMGRSHRNELLRIAEVVEITTSQDAENIRIAYKMKDLASLLCSTRVRVDKMLKELEEVGVLAQSQELILVPNRRKFIETAIKLGQNC